MSVVSQSARGRGQFNDAELDLSALGTTLWRKRWKILRPTILVGLVTLLAVQVITPDISRNRASSSNCATISSCARKLTRI